MATSRRLGAVATLVCALVRPGTSLLIPSAHLGGSLATPSSPARQCVRVSAPASRLRLRPLVLCAAEERPPLPSISSPEVALVVGSVLLTVLVANRLFTEDLLNSQSRADLIATAGATVLLLEALTRLDITPREADSVPLDGVKVTWVDPALPAAQRRELDWAADALTSCLPARSLAIVRDGRTIGLRGTLSARVASDAAAYGQAVAPGPLLLKCLESTSGAPDYLPSLQILPGRFEFTYLPAATQALLLVPLPGISGGAIILGADQARAFKEDDVAWARTVASGLGAWMSVG